MAFQIQKMANLDYHYSVAEMAALKGGRLGRVYEIEKDVFRFRVSQDGKKHDLMARLGVSFALSRAIPESPRDVSSFAALLRKHLDNARVESIEQVAFDRLVRIEFRKEELHSLYFEMFARGNLVLCDAEGKVVAAYREQGEGKRVVRRGTDYVLPPSSGASPFHCEKIRLPEQESPLDGLKKAVAIAPSYYSDFAGSADARKAGKDNERLKSALAQYVSDKDFTVYYAGGAAAGFSSVRLSCPEKFFKKDAGLSSKPFVNFSQALDEYYLNAPTGEKDSVPRNARQEKLLRQKLAQERAVRESDLEADRLKGAGNAIYLNFEKAERMLALAKKQGKKAVELEL